MDNNGTPTTWTATKAGQNLQKRLTNEHTLNSLDGLLAKIDSLEKAVNNLTVMMQQGPGMVAMVTDMADEAYRKADASGVSVDERLGNAMVLAEKLTAPAMVEKLNGLMSLADQAPGLVAMTMDMVDEGYRKADANGVSIDERLGNAMVLAEKLTAPAMVEKLDGLMTLADQAPGLVAMSMDMFDEGMKNAIDKGFDLQALGNIAGASNRALTAASAEPPAKVGGIFGLLRVLKDNDRQKGLGFLMNFLKHLGRNL